MAKELLIPVERIERAILMIRGQKVMLDSDLAELYGVPTKRLNEQVRRNQRRFPDDFMFQLTAEEAAVLRSQFATLDAGRGKHRKYLPYAFTEQGVAMLSTVLSSDRAIEVNIAIMRAFVRLREILATHKDLARKLAVLLVPTERLKTFRPASRTWQPCRRLAVLPRPRWPRQTLRPMSRA